MRGVLTIGTKRSRGRAFSLLETLVALTIFAVAIVALIEGIAQNARTQVLIENESRAAMLAQNVMEEIEYVGELVVGSDSGQFSDEDSPYSWSSEILQSDQEGLLEVRVTVSWAEGEAQRDFQLVTYLRPTDTETTGTLR